MLVTTRTREARRFADPRKAMLLLLRQMEIATIYVDATHWRPDEAPAGSQRSDSSAAMKRAHEAAAHDRWFRSEVEDGLREAEDPATVRVSHQDVMAELRTVIDRAAEKSSRRRER